MKKRIVFLFFAIVAALVILAGRVFWFQFVRGEELRAKAQEVRTRYIPVEAKRGVITDARGRELAISISVDTIVANPAEIKDPQKTATLLAGVLDLSQGEVLKIITRRTSFEFVQRKISEEKAHGVRQLELPGIYLTQETRRVYPKGGLAANILGFAGMDSQGLEGIERVYDDRLHGESGYISIEYDARNREIPQAVHRYIKPKDGLNAQLTIDETIQYIAERELDKTMIKYQPRAAWIIVMNPKTGEILAMAQRPSYDPNRAMDYLLHLDPGGKADADPKLWRNPAISDAYPPGSVFKPVTAAMALTDGKVTPATPFYDKGSLTVPGSIVSNWDGGGLGSTNFAEAFAFSANTVFAQVGLRVGTNRFYDYLEAFGFDAYTGIDLPGEGVGLAPPRKEAKPLDLALMAFGQTLTVTPIRLATVTSALINGGKLMQPHVVKAFTDKDGKVVERFEPKVLRQVIPKETSDTMRMLMGKVAGEGTGRGANVPGYLIGGKTGTSQKVIGGIVSTDKHIGSFIGFAPLEDPQILIYVMVDEPRGLPYGGVVAAPAFASVARDTLHYLGVPPSVPVEGEDGPPADLLSPLQPTKPGKGEVEVPDLLNLAVSEARARTLEAGLTLSVVGADQVVWRQVPAAGAVVKRGARVVVYTGGAGAAGGQTAEGLVTVPDLRGRTMREVAQLLGAINLRLDAQGSGVAVGQDPPAGTRLPARALVRVTFQPPDGVRELVPPSPR